MTYCESTGMRLGEKIRVLQEGRIFKKGDIITLTKELGGGDSPWFVSDKTGRGGFFALKENTKFGYLPEGEGWERVSKQDNEGWIEWTGTKCPVGIGKLVDVEHQDGCIYKNQRAGVKDSHAEDWDCKGDGAIVAYRLSSDNAIDDLKKMTGESFWGKAHRISLVPIKEETTIRNLKRVLKKKRKHEKKSQEHLQKVSKLTTKSQELIDQLSKEVGVKLRFVDALNSDEVVDTSLLNREIPEGVEIYDPATWKNGDIIKCIEDHVTEDLVTEGNHYTFIKLDDWGDPTIEKDDKGRTTSPADVRYVFVRRP